MSECRLTMFDFRFTMYHNPPFTAEGIRAKLAQPFTAGTTNVRDSRVATLGWQASPAVYGWGDDRYT